jgi:glyoxylase-like metal-dependent hydrolase (beta-lactamase superfamily II)
VTTAFASATDTADQKAKLVEFATDVYGYVSDFDPNVGLIVGDKSCLVIDTRATPRMAREFIADIRTITDKPVRHVFLTHYHAVRVLGASAYENAEIISSRDTLEMIRTTGQFDYEVEVRRFPRLFKGIEEIPGLTIPHLTFDREMSFWFGGREVRLRAAGRGHTAGDSICWLPEDRVLFTGDLLEQRATPYTGEGFLSDWITRLNELAALDAKVAMPGRGAALTGAKAVQASIAEMRGFLVALRNVVGGSVEQGLDLVATYKRALAELKPHFGDWAIFGHALPFDVARAFDEARGIDTPVPWTAERDQDLWKALHD